MAKPYHQSPLEQATSQAWWKADAILGLVIVIFLALMAAGSLIAYLRLSAGDAGQSPDPFLPPPTPTIDTTTPTPVLSPTPSTQATETINVYFSRRPESEDNFLQVYQVPRTVEADNAPQEAMIALIQGPATAESQQQLFSEWSLSGISTCGGDDFQLSINNGTATVRLCKDFISTGVGQDARAQAQADTTLRQFPDIERVIFLNKDGNCLFDQSGLNQCLM